MGVKMGQKWVFRNFLKTWQTDLVPSPSEGWYQHSTYLCQVSSPDHFSFSRYRVKWGSKWVKNEVFVIFSKTSKPIWFHFVEKGVKTGVKKRPFRLYLEKSPFVFLDFLHVNRFFSENHISGNSLVPDFQVRKVCQIDPKWDLWVYFEIGWLYEHIRLISHLLDILQHLKSLKNSEVETSPFRTLQFSTLVLNYSSQL